MPVRRGPPPKTEPETPNGQMFNSAEEYLEAVVAGTTPPDSVRVTAARVLMGYQLPRVRAPLLAEKTPRRQAISDANAAERQLLDEWAEKAAAVRKRLERAREKQEQ